MGLIGRRVGEAQTVGGAGGCQSLDDNYYFAQSFNTVPSPGVVELTATGGMIGELTSGGKVYKTHTFTSSGTLTVTKGAGDVEYLVVAGGGGGGGAYYSGGGGGGGVRTNIPGYKNSDGNTFAVAEGSYSIVVGGGGNGGVGPGGNVPGNLSSFGPASATSGIVTSYGGGAGGAGSGSAPNVAVAGGSGGGGAYANKTHGEGINPTTPSPILGPLVPGAPHPYPFVQGHGGEDSSPRGGAGGGGAASDGEDWDPGFDNAISGATAGNNAGIGTAIAISGITTHYGAGGAGNAQASTDAFTPKQSGVGGATIKTIQASNPSNPLTPVANQEIMNGVAGTGSGGGGADKRNTGYLHAGAGSGGTVIVRYEIGSVTATAKATGGDISVWSNPASPTGKTCVHTFTKSGTFTNTESSPLDVEAVIVGGGAGGGMVQGGGGGAGGYQLDPAVTCAPTTVYTVVVGAGGVGGRYRGYRTQSPGTSTHFSAGPMTRGGGGQGGQYPSNPTTSGENTKLSEAGQSPGGCGGGGGGDDPTGSAGNTPGPATGFSGGDGVNPGSMANAGGGGGDGGDGGDASASGPGGQGGAGQQLPATFRDPASSVGGPGPSGNYWVGGGGGGGADSRFPGGSPASGGGGGNKPVSAPHTPASGWAGGGDGGTSAPGGQTVMDGYAADQNTGGGGGGGAYFDPNGDGLGGNGGSGLVVLAYPV